MPGPTALTAALAISGWSALPWVFAGFPPRKSNARCQMFREFAGDARTVVVYESPNRLLHTLRDAYAELGERQVVIACELTKLYEQVWRGTLGQAIAHWRAETPRGEFVVLISGASQEES